jgi:hypothetical protein
MHRRTILIAIIMAVAAPRTFAQARQRATLYKNPQCDCCEGHATYLRGHGYDVTVVPTHDLDAIKSRHGVPERLAGCHTILVGGYVVEGHVPAQTLERLLRERPPIRGISLPGMPQGSPGMTGRKEEPFKIFEFGRNGTDKPAIYAVE